MNFRFLSFSFSISLLLISGKTRKVKNSVSNEFVLMSGEPSVNSILLQSHLVKTNVLVGNDNNGMEGEACFQVSIDSLFTNYKESLWEKARKTMII